MNTNDYYSHLSKEIANAVIDTYRKLPKKGKPLIEREWTLLAGVVMSIKETSGIKLKTVSLGTGSKCVGKSKMSCKGDILNDSHAEVLARRSFLRFLYEELEKTQQETSEVFIPPNPELGNRCSLQPNVAFHFFTSHTPCGDASIFPKTSKRNHKKVCNLDASHQLNINGNMHKSQDGLESFDVLNQQENSVTQSTKSSGDSTYSATCTFDQCSTAPVDFNLHPKCFSPRDVSIYPETLQHNSISADSKITPQNSISANSEINPQNSISTNSEINPQNSISTNSEINPQNIISANSEINPQNSISTNSEITPQNIISANSEIHTVVSRKRKYVQISAAESHIDINKDEYDDIGDACLNQRSHTVASDLDGSLNSADVDDVYRTGAKCVPGDEQDPFAPASRCPYSTDALHRAVISRVYPISSSLSPPYKVNKPVLSQAIDLEFEASRGQTEQKDQCVGASQRTPASKTVPAASAIMWFLSSKSDVLNHDVTVNGRRQGITKTDIHKPQARSSICSISLFRCFHNLLDKIKPTSVPTSLGIESMKTLTYWETKSLATKYQAAWADLRDSIFRTWISKQRELLNFCVND